ncbi:c-type cytochrome [Actomonas aquatica]|uniref:C-type cytochrome n=1 Tax=Actomonas aquatica TaxID=2866162 RepID=A0ABZ1CF24_9BACT|nr:c-type cytochrome [Opitutus sp. WL0086]WRQ88890.1 c-type cytochrome [Opitutus sp. WL0086]
MAPLANAGDLTLSTESSSPYDLAILGGLDGVPAGETRYVSWDEVAGLPTTTLELTGEFVPGKQEVTVVFVEDLWKVLPVAAEADTLLAWCTDDYFSIYPPEFIAKQKPFVVVKINGDGPDKWPPEGLSFNPGPYVISVADEVVPGTRAILDVGHKRPWGVDKIKFVNEDEALAPAFAGEWSDVSELAAAGRTIWVNSCSSCHPGPGGLVGGNKSQRPFPVLQAHAKYNTDYFRKYVRDPKSLVPSATMEPHPHYTDAQLDALVAFISAESGE